MKRELMSGDEIQSGLEKLEGWVLKDKMLSKKLKFENFAESLKFVNQVGEIAEAADHHPDITFGWGYAEISITTHDRGGVTDVDFSLAAKIDEIRN